MRVDVEGAIQVTGIGTVIGIRTKSGSGSGTESGKGLGREMVEEAVMGEEGWIGSIIILEMEEREAEIDTVSVIGAGRVPLLGVDAGGHPEVQFAHITELCR